MTKELDELEQKISLAEDNIRLKKENARLKKKIKSGPSKFESFGEFLGDYVVEPIRDHGWDVVKVVVGASLIAGLAFGFYQGGSCAYNKAGSCYTDLSTRSERREKEKNERVQQKFSDDDKNIQMLIDGFHNAVNQKDHEALKEFLVCDETRFSDNYSFMETVADKVIDDGYTLKEIKIVEEPDVLKTSISGQGHPLGVWQYNVKINAKLPLDDYNQVLNPDSVPKILNGSADVWCKENCVFMIRKDYGQCPKYSREK